MKPRKNNKSAASHMQKMVVMPETTMNRPNTAHTTSNANGATNQESRKNKLSKNTEEIFDTIRGTLKLIDEENGKFEFHDIKCGMGTNLSAKCEFNKDMLDQAISAVGKEISVRGLCLYEPNGNFPYEIVNIDGLSILVDDGLESLIALGGSMPDYTGDQTTSEWRKDLQDSLE